jgi:hypothetical protein
MSSQKVVVRLLSSGLLISHTNGWQIMQARMLAIPYVAKLRDLILFVHFY